MRHSRATTEGPLHSKIITGECGTSAVLVVSRLQGRWNRGDGVLSLREGGPRDRDLIHSAVSMSVQKCPSGDPGVQSSQRPEESADTEPAGKEDRPSWIRTVGALLMCLSIASCLRELGWGRGCTGPSAGDQALTASPARGSGGLTCCFPGRGKFPCHRGSRLYTSGLFCLLSLAGTSGGLPRAEWGGC